MTKEQAIDKKRRAAVTIKITDDDDESPIRMAVAMEGRLLTVSDYRIYASQLADDIDPERTNIDVPDVHRKELDYGFDNETVQRIFILAETLFVETQMGKEFKRLEGLEIALKATRSILEMQEKHNALQEKVDSIVKQGLKPNTGQSQNIPSIKNLDTDVSTFIDKLDEVRQAMIDIMKLFYPYEGRKVMQGIISCASDKHGADADIVRFLQEIKTVIQFYRNIRNADEHPKEDDKLVVRDFTLNPDMQVDLPSVEFIHPTDTREKTSITSFMEQLCCAAVDHLEMLMVNLCAMNLGALSGFDCGIGEAPEWWQKKKGSRFCYVVNLNGEWKPLG